MTIIGLKELRQNAGKIAERVAKGERFTVVKRSSPVFQIIPLETEVTPRIQDTVEWTKKYVKANQQTFNNLADK